MLPNKPLASSNDTVAGTKLIKDRLTIATSSNADETHKLPLFVIGKSKKPRAFKNINLYSLRFIIAIKNPLGWIAIFSNLGLSTSLFHLLKRTCIKKKLPVCAVLLLDNAP